MSHLSREKGIAGHRRIEERDPRSKALEPCLSRLSPSFDAERCALSSFACNSNDTTIRLLHRWRNERQKFVESIAERRICKEIRVIEQQLYVVRLLNELNKNKVSEIERRNKRARSRASHPLGERVLREE
ncbi:hypothetical protein KM043_007456 [Ampulex compressa]|nr:hypothetical protein KM043_007456 [Ampulex compressa]